MRGAFLCSLFGVVSLALVGCGGSSSSANIATPSISGVVPTTPSVGASFTINGANLNGIYTTAYFATSTGATTLTTATSGGTDSASFIVPTSLASGSYSLFVSTTNPNNNISPTSNSLSVTVLAATPSSSAQRSRSALR